MGTSKRKTNQKIKELLQESIENESKIDSSSINDFIPTKSISNYTNSDEFSQLVREGLEVQRLISNRKFKSLPFSAEDLSDATPLNIQQIKDKILDMIEKETGNEIVPSLVTNAFNNTMTEVILGKINNPYEYLSYFCENLLYYILMENINEPIIDIFSTNDEIDRFRKKKREEIKKYVSEYLKPHIEKFINGKISMEKLIEYISGKNV